MIGLPTELWLLVVSYLLKEEVNGLYSVNSALFCISMNERYRHIIVNFQELNIFTLQLLEWLQIQPTLAHRVRTLTLIPSSTIGLSESRGDGIQLARWVNHRIMNFKPYAKPEVESEAAGHSRFEPLVLGHVTIAQLDKALCRIIPLMGNLRELDLRCDGEVASLTCYELLWRRCEDTLTDLHLDIVINQFPSIFKVLDQGRFHANVKLRSISLSLSKAPPSPWEEVPRRCRLEDPPAMEVIAAFLGFCRSSLQKLKIVNNHGRQQYADLTALFSRLEYLPSLSEIAVDIGAPEFIGISDLPTDTPCRVSFLQQHATSIKVLQLSPIVYNATFNIGALHFPSLQSLSIPAAFLISTPEPVALTFFEKHGVYLNRLDVTASSFFPIIPLAEPNPIPHIIKGIWSSNPSHALQELRVWIAVFSVELMNTFALAVNLRKLCVELSEVSLFPTLLATRPSAKFSPYKQESLLPKLKRYEDNFRNWGLQDLMIERYVCCGRIALWGMMISFADGIPAIKSFAGRGTKAIPNPPNETSKNCNPWCTIEREGDYQID